MTIFAFVFGQSPPLTRSFLAQIFAKSFYSLVAMVFGVSACLTVSPVCIVAGIWQISAGFIVIVIEVTVFVIACAIKSSY